MAANLSIPVERLREGPLELEIDVRPEALDLTDEDYTFTSHVTGKVVFRIVGNDVLGQGDLDVKTDSACVRCLNPAHLALHAKVDEIWMRNKPEEEEVDREFLDEAPLTRSYSGDEIPLDEAFRELIMSELPERALCREDCKGLCPGCGVDLNTEACHCKPAETEARTEEKLPEWKQALKKIKLDPNS